MAMNARFTSLLPLAAAAALALAGGEAKALVIRYDFDDAAETASGYTGGTIEVGSIDQTLGTSPTTFTVEINNNPFTVVADFSEPLSGPDDISYFTFPENSWEAANFNFGAITPTTQWSSLLGTFTGTDGGFGTFNWTSPSLGGNLLFPRPSSITFSVPVPGPLPILGAAAALGWSRRLRKRIQDSTPSTPPNS